MRQSANRKGAERVLLDILFDVIKDTAKLIPFLFVTYLIMEAIEEKAESHSEDLIIKAGPAGPALAALKSKLGR